MRTLEHATLQGSLFGAGEPAIAAPLPAHRVDLAHGAWIVRVPGWIAGEQTLLQELSATTTWHAGRRFFPRAASGFAVWFLAIAASTVLCGFHYPVDVLAGLVTGAA